MGGRPNLDGRLLLNQRVCGELLIFLESAIRHTPPTAKAIPKHKLAYNRTMLPKMDASPSTAALSTAP